MIPILAIFKPQRSGTNSFIGVCQKKSPTIPSDNPKRNKANDLLSGDLGFSRRTNIPRNNIQTNAAIDEKRKKLKKDNYIPPTFYFRHSIAIFVILEHASSFRLNKFSKCCIFLQMQHFDFTFWFFESKNRLLLTNASGGISWNRTNHQLHPLLQIQSIFSRSNLPLKFHAVLHL